MAINIHVTVAIMVASLKTLILGGIIGVDISDLKECAVPVERYRHCTVILQEFLVRPKRRYRRVTTFDAKTWTATGEELGIIIILLFLGY